eukprot:TRINITY_DN6807_c0_g1_i1.p1 TRINITY_DN6807_c0_g1~~TRINITY_DN6807_c0_g1_i1.p1  ORF type:complete len:501 (+),score=66.39 TRINITY_DN6807_c0_g1_i1:213-1715(+)
MVQQTMLMSALGMLKQFFNWAKQLGIAEEDASKLRSNKIEGLGLLTLTEDKLLNDGFHRGPAAVLAMEIEKLRMGKVCFDLSISKERLDFITSPSLDHIKLPINPQRYYSYSGPIHYKHHYCIPSFLRGAHVNQKCVLDLIAQAKYFVLHEQRQSGKTTFLHELQDLLNSREDYAALYINVEAGQQTKNDIRFGMATIMDELDMQCETTFNIYLDLKNKTKHVEPTKQLEEALSIISQQIHKDKNKKFVLLLDEIDALVGDTLLSVLRQLQSGYDKRFTGFAPFSVYMVGVRDVRDYRIYSEKDKKYIVGGSAFNIAAETRRIPQFSKSHVEALARQHEEEKGQKFDKEAIDELYEITDGQPWCVNRILYETVTVVSPYKVQQTITQDNISTATENVINGQDIHLISMKEILHEPKVYTVVNRILSCETLLDVDEETISYVEDLGLIKKNKHGFYTFSNKIYNEVITRALSKSYRWKEIVGPLGLGNFRDTKGKINVPSP